ncbi:short chain dehydrogenase family protein [Mycobacterium kansasii]|uniref:Short chain dehydrogenase family protein n=1 Tax=Mycobacterium kansasii TaxID=1768 RepID=A0A1V3WV23_MYCKA|nr:short chain dehydrogenase family protein [Mycobacterium kansasii]
MTVAAMRDLQGKVAVVTGGAGGIGRAMGRRFGQEGMKVVLADVLAEPLGAATRELADAGIEVAGSSPTLPTIPRSSHWPGRRSANSARCTWCATTPAPAGSPRATCGNTT